MFRRLSCLLLAFVFCCSVAFAAGEVVDVPIDDYPANGYVVLSDIPEAVEVVDVSATAYTVRPSDTNGLTSVVLGLIGDYNPIVTDYTYRNNNSSYETHSITVTPDWPWIISAAIFSLVLFCCLKVLGGVICLK